MTSLLSSAMIIDNNPIFGTFVLTDSPSSALTISASYVAGYDAVKYIPGKSYEVLLAIRATQNVTTSDPDNPSGVNYKITMTDASFSFSSISSCIIADRTAGECSCSAISGKKYQMLVSCASDLVISGSDTYNEITV